MTPYILSMKPRILIVDDDEKNLALLAEKMARDGYETALAVNGIEALEKTAAFHPDLIMLDIMMPKMDGYEALRRLKSSEETKYIPVILLTGKGETDDKVLGFDVGAEDYIIKPFSLREVSARVKALLRMRALQAKLLGSEKMAALGGMVDGIAHEIRNPLTTIGGIARRLLDSESNPQHKTYAKSIISSVERLERMLQRIDEYKSILSSTLAVGDLQRVIPGAIGAVKYFCHDKDIEIKTSLMDSSPSVCIDYENLKIALINVLQNSIEAIEGSGEILIETFDSDDDTVTIRITDSGGGIKEAEVRGIFNPFQTSKLSGAGLGLTITHRIISDHGGEIEVHSEQGKGTVVSIKLNKVIGFPSPGASPEASKDQPPQ